MPFSMPADKKRSPLARNNIVLHQLQINIQEMATNKLKSAQMQNAYYFKGTLQHC